jgi:hypothetical protein
MLAGACAVAAAIAALAAPGAWASTPPQIYWTTNAQNSSINAANLDGTPSSRTPIGSSQAS